MPNTRHHTITRTPNSSFALGPVIRRAHPCRPPSATSDERRNVTTKAAATDAATRKMNMLFGKSWNQIVKIVTRGILRRGGSIGAAAAWRGQTILAEGRRGPVRASALPSGRRQPPNRTPHELRSPWPLRRPPPLVDRRGVGVAPAGRGPARATRVRGAVRRRVHPQRSRVGSREAGPPG